MKQMDTIKIDIPENHAGSGSADAACSAETITYPKHMLRMVVQLENSAKNVLIMESLCAAAKAMVPENIDHGVIKLEEVSFVRARVLSRPNARGADAIDENPNT